MSLKSGPLPPTYLLLCLALSLSLHFFWPLKEIIPPPWSYLGLIFITGGIGLNLWADQALKKAQTTVKPSETPSRLVREGPFRFSRHPMYLGFVLLLLGVCLVLGTLSPFLAPLLMGVILQIDFIPEEEKRLKEAFGQEYQDYRHRVRPWL